MSERIISLRQNTTHGIAGTGIFLKVGPSGAFALKTPAMRHRTVEGMNSPTPQTAVHPRSPDRLPAMPELRAGGP